MNIFVLDENPVQAAVWHVDRHAVKLPLEAAQMLCTNLHLAGVPAHYRPGFANHPCTKWSRASRDNFLWLCSYGLAVAAEYTHRYGRVHACQAIIADCQQRADVIPAGPRTPFAQAMPLQYQQADAVLAYRAYYCGAKGHLARWSFRQPPCWWQNPI